MSRDRKIKVYTRLVRNAQTMKTSIRTAMAMNKNAGVGS